MNRKQKLRNRVISEPVGPWVNALDYVLKHYKDSGGPLYIESRRVTRLAMILMMHRYFNEDDLILISDMSKLGPPPEMTELSGYEVNRVLNGKTLEQRDSYSPGPSALLLDLEP